MELQGKFFKDNDSKFRSQLIKVRSMELAAADLNKYYTFLDKCGCCTSYACNHFD